MVNKMLDTDVFYTGHQPGKWAHMMHMIEHNPPGQRLMVVCSDKQTVDMLTELLKDKQVDVTIVNLPDSSAQNTT